MPIRDSVPEGAPIWVDLSTSDPQRAKDFYPKLFGWTFEDMGSDLGNYVNFSKDGVVVAGMMANQQPGAPDSWTTYLNTSDAKATTDAALAADGTVVFGPDVVAELGTMAGLIDPSGAVIGVWQPEKHRGSGLTDEHGTPIWHELHTHDYSTAVRFYQQVFGWQTVVMSDTAEFRYTVLDQAGTQYAGIMDASGFLPSDVPSNWQVYFQTNEISATLSFLEKLGGTVHQPAEDTPYGWMAEVADPTGARFKLLTPPPSS